MKKTIIIILIAMLALPMLFADTSPVANATLTLQTKVRDYVLHGFTNDLPESTGGSIVAIDVLTHLIGYHENDEQFLENYDPIYFAKDNTISYEDVVDFDFGDEHSIGYYMFIGNSPVGFDVSFNVSDFTHDDGAEDVVSWILEAELNSSVNMSSDFTEIASGEVADTRVLKSTTSKNIKWGILELTANFGYGDSAYFASGTYTATVVAHVTAN